MASAMNFRQSIEAWFAAADEKTRRRRILIAVAMVLATATALLMLFAPKKPKPLPKPEAPDATLVTAPKRQQDLEGINRELATLKQQLSGAEEKRRQDLANLERKQEALIVDAAKKAATIDDATLERLIANRVESKVEKLAGEGKLLPRGGTAGVTLPPPTLGTPLPGAAPNIPLLPPATASTSQTSADAPAQPKRSLRSGVNGSASAATATGTKSAGTTTAEGDSSSQASSAVASNEAGRRTQAQNEARQAAANAPNEISREAVTINRDKKQNDAIHLPIGSILSGVTITGIDAPTGAAAQRTPIPALLRLKHEAILPNHFRVDIRECFVLVSGFGSLSTQRAKLRSNAISCVRNDGRVVEAQLAGYVVGPDSREGIQGTLVHKSGELLRNSLMAGVLSAGAARLGGTTSVSAASLAGGGGAAGLLGGNSAEGALASGAGQSIAQISKLYLDMAKEAVPVVEVLPGTSVTIVLTSGVSLRFGG